MAQIRLAEPDKPIRDFIAGILSDFGHTVTGCENCVEAAALLATGPIDVLVTDLVLGDGDGSTFGKDCIARGIPTITLTGQEFGADPVKQAAIALVEKPFRFDDLQCVLDAVAHASESTKAAA